MPIFLKTFTALINVMRLNKIIFVSIFFTLTK